MVAFDQQTHGRPTIESKIFKHEISAYFLRLYETAINLNLWRHYITQISNMISLKEFVVLYVLCSPHKLKPWMASAMITWWKFLSKYTRYFMSFIMLGVVNYPVDS